MNKIKIHFFCPECTAKLKLIIRDGEFPFDTTLRCNHCKCEFYYTTKISKHGIEDWIGFEDDIVDKLNKMESSTDNSFNSNPFL